MAVVRAPVQSKAELWESGGSDISFHLSDPHAFSMAYSFMTPPANQARIETAQPAYHPDLKLPSQDPSGLEGKRKDSDGSLDDQPSGVALRRSLSTPNKAHIAQSGRETAAQAGSTGEKKRNKLGYYRTSIACSHCRRRKIRCIASPDVQNRCVNCIRLKKECSFYPVDQQPGVESRSKVSARQVTGSGIASTNSSPAVVTGSPREMASRLVVPGMAHGSKAPTGGDDFYPSEVKVPSNGLAPGQYSYANQPPNTWAADISAKPENLSMAWHSYGGESPISTQFSPYVQSAASATWASGNSESESHDEMAWSDFQPPVRAMSLSGESNGSHQQLQYLSVGQGQPFDRRQSALSDVYNPSFCAPVPSMASGSMAEMENAGPFVTGSLPSNAEPWQQALLSQNPSPFTKPATAYGDWQYDKAGSSQPMWFEEQRPPSTAAQASSEAYYSA